MKLALTTVRQLICATGVALSLVGCTTTNQQSASSDVSPILAAMQTRPAMLTSRVYNWNEIAVQTTAVGQRRGFFDAPSATLDNLEMHITTLKPGEQAHAPHRHGNEEMILLKEGTLEALINDKTYPMPTGSVLLVEPNDLHVVKNVGTTNATYFVVAWRTPKTPPNQTAAAAPAAP